MRGTEGDGGLEILRHAHAQAGEIIAPGKLRKQGEMQRRFLVDGWNAHKADHRKAQFVAAETDEGIGFPGDYARLLRLLTGVHLDEEAGNGVAAIPDLGELAGQPWPVKTVDEIEQPEGVPHLVGLQGADEMEPNSRKLHFQWRPFRLCLLHPVFAVIKMARRDKGADKSGPVKFGNADETYSGGVASGPRGRLRDPLPQGGQFGDR